MRKAFSALAAAAMALGVLGLPVSSARASSGPVLVCLVQPSEYSNYMNVCPSDIPSSGYGVSFLVQGGSGTYSYSWTVPGGVTVFSGCTSTSSSCVLSVKSHVEHDIFMSVVLTQGGTQTTLTAEAYTPAVCGGEIC